jgi:tRNA 2-thiouridine synthesizing protein A
MIAKTVDARGLKCPLPVLLAQKALRAAAAGALIEVLATDRGADEDFADLCVLTGAALVESGEDAGVYRFVLRAPAEAISGVATQGL